MKIIANVRVGRRQIKPSAPSHVAGVREGNEGTHKHKGITFADGMATGSARRSTGISPSKHDVIDPRMPRLSPA